MDITESGFQTPASKKRKASGSPSLPPASQPTTPPSNYKNKTPLIATGIDPKFNMPIKIMSELRQYHPNLSFTNQADKKWLDFHRRYSERFRNPAERAKNAASFREKSWSVTTKVIPLCRRQKGVYRNLRPRKLRPKI